MSKKLAFMTILIALCLIFTGGERMVLGVTAESEVSSVKAVINPVVFVRFKNETEFCNDAFIKKLDDSYNNSTIGMRSFFLEDSLGKYDVKTEFLINSSIEVEKTVDYYMPRYSFNEQTQVYDEVNAVGYDNRYFADGVAVSPYTGGALEHVDRFYREQALLREIAEKVTLSSSSSFDHNGDGAFDSFTIMLSGENYEETSWNGILWPHMSNVAVVDEKAFDGLMYLPEGFYDENMSFIRDKALIGELMVGSYNILSKGYISKVDVTDGTNTLFNVGVLCHEHLHTLGIYDYYSYVQKTYESVGELDILGTTKPHPQMNLAYIRQKLGWLEEGTDILPITSSGNYSLSAVTSRDEVKAYKLVLNDYESTGEYFMLEMRSNAGNGFDKSLAGSGLVVYRINENNGYIGSNGELGNVCYGNMYGGKGSDEVYVYRLGSGDNVAYEDSSYALLDGSDFNADGVKYQKSRIGSTDLGIKKTEYLFSESGSWFTKKRIYNTTIHYSDKKNSGIEISEIKLDETKTKVSFNIKFDDTSAGVEENFSAKIIRDNGGKRHVFWSTAAREGTAYVLAVEIDSSLISIENDVVTPLVMPTEEEIKNGKMEGYNTVIHSKTPISFKKAPLKNDGKGYVVYLLLDDGQSQKICFVDAVYDEIETKTVFRIKPWVWYLVGAVVLLVVLLVISCVISLVLAVRKRNN